jgi:outer membrane receptor for ferrienterochelin and colicin
MRNKNEMEGTMTRSSKGLRHLPAACLLAMPLAAQAAPAQTTEETPAPAEIIVTGMRASLSSAQSIKRNSQQLVDSVIAEDIGKLPDNNVVEALQRVPGIQVSPRARGESATVLIRGCPMSSP